jgi:hypothetical protein
MGSRLSENRKKEKYGNEFRLGPKLRMTVLSKPAPNYLTRSDEIRPPNTLTLFSFLASLNYANRSDILGG